MGKDYRDGMGYESPGIPEIELRLASDHPPGVLESYHVSLDVFSSTIQEALDCASTDEDRALLNVHLHRIVAGTAMYAYSCGLTE